MLLELLKISMEKFDTENFIKKYFWKVIIELIFETCRAFNNKFSWNELFYLPLSLLPAVFMENSFNLPELFCYFCEVRDYVRLVLSGSNVHDLNIFGENTSYEH